MPVLNPVDFVTKADNKGSLALANRFSVSIIPVLMWNYFCIYNNIGNTNISNNWALLIYFISFAIGIIHR